MTELEQIRSSVVQVKIGNRYYDAVQNSRCGVCMHPGRFQIESKILLNFGWPAVSKFASDLNKQRTDGSTEEWPALSPQQVKRHWEQGHCPVEGDALRALAEERAKKLGIDLEEATGNFIDHEIVQHAVLVRGLELLQRGDIEPDVKDLLAVAKEIGANQKEDQNSATEDQWRQFMGVYFDAVQSVVSSDQWVEIVSLINSSPAYQRMTTQEQHDVEEAEIIE